MSETSREKCSASNTGEVNIKFLFVFRVLLMFRFFYLFFYLCYVYVCVFFCFRFVVVARCVVVKQNLVVGPLSLDTFRCRLMD